VDFFIILETTFTYIKVLLMVMSYHNSVVHRKAFQTTTLECFSYVPVILYVSNSYTTNADTAIQKRNILFSLQDVSFFLHIHMGTYIYSICIEKYQCHFTRGRTFLPSNRECSFFL